MVYGGLDGASGEILTDGALLGPEGERSTFSTTERLIDPRVVALADHVLITGLACDDAPKTTDTGVQCEPAEPIALVVATETGTVTPVALGDVMANPYSTSLVYTSVESSSEGDAASLTETLQVVDLATGTFADPLVLTNDVPTDFGGKPTDWPGGIPRVILDDGTVATFDAEGVVVAVER